MPLPHHSIYQANPDSNQLNFLGGWVNYWTERTPSAIAMTDDKGQICYSELDACIKQVSRSLVKAGIRSGDRVACLDNPTINSMVIMLATMEAGAVFLGLNPKYKRNELAYQIDNAEPRLILSQQTLLGRDYKTELADITVNFIWLESEQSSQPDQLLEPLFSALNNYQPDTHQTNGAPQDRSPDDPCLLVYTSGSTGAPKGALLSHRSICSFATRQNSLWPISPLSLVNYFPINHIGALLDAAAFCLVGGGTQHLMPRFHARDCLELMQNKRVSLWITIPSVFQLILDLPDFDSFDLSALKLVVWEGASPSPALLQRLHSLGVDMATNYGMTETGSAITATHPSRDLNSMTDTVGPAFPDSDVKLSDEPGREGEVLVKSPSNFIGYWRNDKATQESFTSDGYFKTGDLAQRKANGSFQLIGRLKEMFKSGGYNVYPKEVEEVLLSSPDVDEAVIVSVDDPIWDEVGYAFLIGSGQGSDDSLAAWCSDRLANYKIPKHFAWIDEFPKLPIGKIDRSKLKQIAESNLRDAPVQVTAS